MMVDLSQEEINAIIPACLLAEGNQKGAMLARLYQDLTEINAETVLPGVRSKLADASMKEVMGKLQIAHKESISHTVERTYGGKS